MINPLHNCIVNKNTTTNPIWFMRQAGRYLPEFREIRKSNPNYINLCLFESYVVFEKLLLNKSTCLVVYNLGKST